MLFFQLGSFDLIYREKKKREILVVGIIFLEKVGKSKAKFDVPRMVYYERYYVRDVQNVRTASCSVIIYLL